MKNKVNRISDVRELYVRRTRVSSFFSSKLIGSYTNLDHMSVVWGYAEYTNLTVFGPKVVQVYYALKIAILEEALRSYTVS